MNDALNSGWLVAIAVAVIPALFGTIGNFLNREGRSPRHIRNLGHLTESLSKADPNSAAHRALSELIADYAFSIRERLVSPRKLNKLNVGFTGFIFLTTAGIMYGLSQWVAASADSAWNVVAVIVTAIIGLSLFLVNVAAVGLWYKPAQEDSKDK